MAGGSAGDRGGEVRYLPHARSTRTPVLTRSTTKAGTESGTDVGHGGTRLGRSRQNWNRCCEEPSTTFGSKSQLVVMLSATATPRNHRKGNKVFRVITEK
eukprot:407311-Rhodomonas_salina.1